MSNKLKGELLGAQLIFRVLGNRGDWLLASHDAQKWGLAWLQVSKVAMHSTQADGKETSPGSWGIKFGCWERDGGQTSKCSIVSVPFRQEKGPWASSLRALWNTLRVPSCGCMLFVSSIFSISDLPSKSLFHSHSGDQWTYMFRIFIWNQSEWKFQFFWQL